MRTLYIGEMIFFKLPEEEQKKFELFNSYKPSYMSESIQWMEDESNQDANLAVINSSNEDFQSKMDISKGSFLIHCLIKN